MVKSHKKLDILQRLHFFVTHFYPNRPSVHLQGPDHRHTRGTEGHSPMRSLRGSQTRLWVVQRRPQASGSRSRRFHSGSLVSISHKDTRVQATYSIWKSQSNSTNGKMADIPEPLLDDGDQGVGSRGRSTTKDSPFQSSFVLCVFGSSSLAKWSTYGDGLSLFSKSN